MADPVTSRDGKSVLANDNVTVVGTVVSVTSGGPTGNVVVKLLGSGNQVTVQGQDVYSGQNS